MRGIYAVDSTTIQLAYWCIKWAKHRQRKAAVKLHMVANVANMLPRFAVVGKASEHDSKREEELFASLLPGDVGVLDRAYNNFPVLYRQTLQLQSFFGENQNAVEWQIWAAMLTHLVLRYIKWKNKVVSYLAQFLQRRGLSQYVPVQAARRQDSPSRPRLGETGDWRVRARDGIICWR